MLLEFKTYASDFYEEFNARQLHGIILDNLEEHMDIGYMMKSHVILNHFPAHSEKRKEIYDSWNEHKIQLVWGMLAGGLFG